MFIVESCLDLFTRISSHTENVSMLQFSFHQQSKKTSVGREFVSSSFDFYFNKLIVKTIFLDSVVDILKTCSKAKVVTSTWLINLLNMINIVDLPFNVLSDIFNQLESFNDKVRFAKAHPNFKDVFEHCQRSDVRSEICFDNNDEDQIYNWRFILEWWGSSVISIVNKYNYVPSDDLVEAAAEYCPNLESIQFEIKEKRNLKKLEENIPKLKMLKDIHITCNASKKKRIYINNLIESLHSLPQLSYLDFSTYFLKKKERLQLNKLTQLKVLRIGRIADSGVKDLSNLLGCLRSLFIKDYPDTKALQTLAIHCIQLETLILLDFYNKSSQQEFYSTWELAYFPKVTFLTFLDNNCQNHFHFLQHLDERYNDQLQVLKMPCLTIEEKEIDRISKLQTLKVLCCADIKETTVDALALLPLENIKCWDSKSILKESILRLVRKSTTLKIVELSCFIDLEFLSKMLEILEEKGFQPNQPFVFGSTYQYEIFRNKDLLAKYASLPKSNLMDLRLL